MLQACGLGPSQGEQLTRPASFCAGRVPKNRLVEARNLKGDEGAVGGPRKDVEVVRQVRREARNMPE